MLRKVAGEWQDVPVVTSGSAPSLTVTPGNTEASLSWTATSIAASTYEVMSGGIVTDVGNVLAYTKTGLTNGTSYSFRVRGKTAAGTYSPWSNEVTVTPSEFNYATGGTVTEVSNYNGTGQTWRIHRFTDNGSLEVVAAGQPFRVLIASGGGGGGATSNYTVAYYSYGSGAGAGGYWHNTNVTLTAGAKAVTVGAAGAAGAGATPGGDGGASSFNGVTPPGGGGGISRTGNGTPVAGRAGGSGSGGYYAGAGGAALDSGAWGYAGHPGASPGAGHGGGAGGSPTGTGTTEYGPGVVNNITGADVEYCRGGRRYPHGLAGAGPGWGGSGGAENSNGGAGAKGEVIIAYRIG